MEIFEYNIIIILIASLCLLSNKSRAKTIFCVIAGIQMALLLGLRDWESCGIDLLRYNRTYEYLMNGDIKNAYEMRDGANILFFLLVALSSKIGISYQLFVSLISVLFIVTVMVLYRKKTSYPLISVFLFLGMGVFTFSFSGLKQVIAMTFAIWSYILHDSDRKTLAYIILVVGILFHPTAIILLPFLLVRNIPVTRYILMMSVLVFAVFMIFRMQIGLILTQFYAEEYVDKYESSNSLTNTVFFIIILLVILLFYKPNQTMIQLEMRNKFYTSFYILFFAVLIQICASYAYSFTRLNYYYMLFLPIAVSNTIDLSRLKPLVSISGLKYILYSILIIIIMYKQYIVAIEAQGLGYYQLIPKFR